MNVVSGSSPADLVIAFRSLPRRRRDAQGDAADAAVADAQARLDDIVARAAGIVGGTTDPVAVADAIERRQPADWTDAQLDELRAVALGLGPAVRAVADAAEAAG